MTGTEYFKQIQDLLNKAAKDKDLSADDYRVLLEDVMDDVDVCPEALDGDPDEPSETDDDGTDLHTDGDDEVPV